MVLQCDLGEEKMFSVVIPAYNCEKTIKKAIDSVLKQTRFDLIREILIVNDGSTDGTEKVIQEYVKRHPAINIRYFMQDNHGASHARNRGIKMANGEWIALLDSDDIWLPEKLERQFEVISKYKSICFLGSSYPVKFLIKKYKSGVIKLTPAQLCIRYMPTTPSAIFKKSVAEELGLFDEKLRYCEDINFFQRFFLKDSYYILIEDLIRIGIGKKYVNETGLSSNLKSMKKARDYNTRQLKEMGLISNTFCYTMLLLNQVKYLRKIGITAMLRFIHS